MVERDPVTVVSQLEGLQLPHYEVPHQSEHLVENFVENVQKRLVRQGMVTNQPKGHVSKPISGVGPMEFASVETPLVPMPTGMEQRNYHAQMQHRYANPTELVNAGRVHPRPVMEMARLKEAAHLEKFVTQMEFAPKIPLKNKLDEFIIVTSKY